MNRFHIFLFIVATCLLFACTKDSTHSPLAPGSITIQQLSGKDTLMKQISPAKDTPVIIGLRAVLNGNVSAGDHFVTFKADTTRLNDYRLKYGNATLLPYGTYLFFSPKCRISAGASLSDSIQLNILAQTRLQPDMVYVLPVVIQNVDGGTDAIAPDQVLYIVVNTTKPVNYISKLNWKIIDFSSVYSPAAAYAPANVLDYDLTTGWTSSPGLPMPQYLTIDFGAQLTFSGVSYTSVAAYYTQGILYPIKVKIEVSVNGTTWTDRGTYNGVTTAVTWTKTITASTARYMRFTVVESAPFISIYTNLTDISVTT